MKAALQRALVLPESFDKHSRIQAMANIISTMIESCSTGKNQIFKSQQQSTMNTMVKLLVKKGVMMDLSRIPHALDLSSPYMANTVNCALKPLEILSRIMNQPQTVLKKKEAGGKTPSGGEDGDLRGTDELENSTGGGGRPGTVEASNSCSICLSASLWIYLKFCPSLFYIYNCPSRTIPISM